MVCIMSKGRELVIKLPIFLEIGIRKKKKFYLNQNITRNIVFHLLNSLKKEMKRVVAGLLNEEVTSWNLARYELELTLYLPNLLKRDVNNVCGVIEKFATDALVELGVLEDDNYNHLQHTSFKYGGYDSNKRGYVLMKVKELDEKDMLEV